MSNGSPFLGFRSPLIFNMYFQLVANNRLDQIVMETGFTASCPDLWWSTLALLDIR